MFKKKDLELILEEPSQRLDALVMLEAADHLEEEDEFKEAIDPIIEMIPGARLLLLIKGLLEGNKYSVNYELKL